MFKPERTRYFEYIDSTRHKHGFFVGRTGGIPAYSAIEKNGVIQGVGDSEISALHDLTDKIEETIYQHIRLTGKMCGR